MLRFPALFVCACALALGVPLGLLSMTRHHHRDRPNQAELASRATTPATQNTFRQVTTDKQ